MMEKKDTVKVLKFKNRSALMRYLAAKYKSGNIKFLRKKIKAKDIKMMWDYQSEGKKIEDVRSEVLNIYKNEIQPLRQERYQSRDIKNPIFIRKKNYILDNQAAFELSKKHFYEFIVDNCKSLQNLPLSVEDNTIIQDHGCFFRFTNREVLDWDYYREYHTVRNIICKKLESVTLYSLKNMPSIYTYAIENSYVSPGALNTTSIYYFVIDKENVETTSLDSVSKALDSLQKRIRHHQMVKMTSSFVEQCRYYKNYCYRFELMDI
ncbi:MAG: hypothetical protein ACYC54_04640 [Sedimentisphaerales bacterium]